MQLAYSLSRLGVEHAALSADDAPGGMFRKWPLFQRMLSWTKPYTGFQPGSREFERHDWNSLAGDDQDHAQPHVERRVHLIVGDATPFPDEVEDRRDRPRRTVQARGDSVGQAAR